MRAPGRHRLDCTFEAVECHASLTLGDNDRLVIVVSAYITLRHLKSPFCSNTDRNFARAVAPPVFRQGIPPPYPPPRAGEGRVGGAAAPLLITTRHCSDSGGRRAGKC